MYQSGHGFFLDQNAARFLTQGGLGTVLNFLFFFFKPSRGPKEAKVAQQL